MSKTHILKTVNPFYRHVERGIKNFEVRKNDRNFQVGDVIILKEFYPEYKNGVFSGDDMSFEITYIYKDETRLMDDYVVLELNNADCEITNDGFFVGDEVIDKSERDRVVSYVLSHKDFPQGIREGYAVICFE